MSRLSVRMLWLPLVGGVVYLTMMAFAFDRLATAVYSNSDAASPPVITECLASQACAHGGVVLGEIGSFTTLWFDLATQWLASHRALWELAPYVLSLGGLVLLVWAARELGGRWAAAVTFALGVSTSSAVLYTLVAQAFHGTTWFSASLLGAVLVRLDRPAAPRRRVVICAMAALIAGLNLASDPLLLPAGVVPFAAAPVLLWVRARTAAARSLAVAACVTAGSSLVIGVAAVVAMRTAGFTTAPVAGGHLGFVRSSAFAGNLQMLTDDVGALFGVGSIGPTGGPDLIARIAMTGLGFAALLLVVGAGLGAARRPDGQQHGRPRSAYTLYWALACLGVAGAFLLSNIPAGGTPSARYLVPLFYAVVAVIPLQAGRSTSRRLLVATGAVTLCVLSTLSLARADLPTRKERLPLLREGGEIIRSLERAQLVYGYSGYWEAAALTWKSRGHLLIAPISACPAGPPRGVCPYQLNAIRGWYRPKRGVRTFVLADRTHHDLDPAGALGVRLLGRPLSVSRFGELTLAVYPYDVARRFTKPRTWGRSFAW